MTEEEFKNYLNRIGFSEFEPKLKLKVVPTNFNTSVHQAVKKVPETPKNENDSSEFYKYFGFDV